MKAWIPATAILAAIMNATPAGAATFAITNSGTTGWANLQSAMNVANTDAELDEIRIKGGITLLGSGSQLSWATGDTNGVKISGGWNATCTARTGGDTTIDANLASRVFQIDSPAVLEYLTVQKGRTGTGDNYGSGLRAEARVRLSHVQFINNQTDGAQSGSLQIRGSGANSVVEYSTIKQGSSGGTGVIGIGADNVFLVNSTICSNSAGGVSVQANKVTLFGCLLHHNSGGTVVGTGGNELSFRLFHCTMADNAADQYGIYNATYATGTYIQQVHNSILSSNGLGIGQSSSTRSIRIGTTITNDIIGTTGVIENGGGNVAVPPGVLGFTDRANQDYTITPESSGFNAGQKMLVMTKAEKDAIFGTGVADAFTVRYVDVGGGGSIGLLSNGAYDALQDVIVYMGFNPGAEWYLDSRGFPEHLVYTTDLAGNKRVRGDLIEMGPYEFQPPAGTIVWMK